MNAERRVYVVEDDEAVRDSVVLAVELAGYKCRPFASAIAFLAEVARLPPGCLVADIRMPGMDGLELLEQLQLRHLPFPTIMMTGHGDVPIAVRAMKSGARDFLEKPFSTDILIDCIVGAFDPARPGPEQICPAEQNGGEMIVKEAAARLSKLTPRERDVLERLLLGQPNKMIARELVLSRRTVEVYRARLMDKMVVKSLAELITTALAGGFPSKVSTFGK